MTSDLSTRQKLIDTAITLFAQQGYEGLSMRELADQVGISLSVSYHYFQTKDLMLDEVFQYVIGELRRLVQELPVAESATEMLKHRIAFQLDNAELVVFALRYFMTFRHHFAKNTSGYIPERAYAHIASALEFGQSTGEFVISDVYKDAKVITHAVNGFVLEYYPDQLDDDEKCALVDSIHEFLLRALTPKGDHEN